AYKKVGFVHFKGVWVSEFVPLAEERRFPSLRDEKVTVKTNNHNRRPGRPPWPEVSRGPNENVGSKRFLGMSVRPTNLPRIEHFRHGVIGPVSRRDMLRRCGAGFGVLGL